MPVSVRPKLKTPRSANSPATQEEDIGESKEEKEKRVTFQQDITPAAVTMPPPLDSPNLEGGRSGSDQHLTPATQLQPGGRDDLPSQQYIAGLHTGQEPATNRVLGAQALSPMSPP